MTEIEKKEIEQEICNYIAMLQSPVSQIGDWKIIKCQEYILNNLEPPYNITELYEKRQVVRNHINELQERLINE